MKIGVCLLLPLIAATAVLAGCGVDNALVKATEDPLKSSGRVTTSGAHQLFDESSFERVNLPALLDPDDKRAERKPSATDQAGGELELAFDAFYRYPNPLQRRNRVQDRLLAASEQRCNLYKNYLKRVETYQSTSFGILTTILGGAGAIATGTVNSRAFAGLAGVSSGIGAELKAGFFANVASQVITPGIDLRREEILNQIRARRSRPISDYTVEAALRDVALYHGACSLIVGLEAAGVAIKSVENPGLARINETLLQLRRSNTLLRDVREPIAADDWLQQMRTLRSATPTGPGASQPATVSDMPLTLLAALSGNLDADFGGLMGTVRARKAENDALIADANADPAKKAAAAAANKLYDAMLNSSDPGSIERRRQDAAKVLYALQGKFGESNGALSDLAARLVSAKGDDKVKIEGQIKTAQNEFLSKKMLPAQTYADKLATQIALAKSAIKAGNAAALSAAWGEIDRIIKAGVAIVA